MTTKGPSYNPLIWASMGIDDFAAYCPGGHHPVQLGQRLDRAGRYRVIHKWANGSSNFWLCQDTRKKTTTKYVVVEVMMANEPEDLETVRCLVRADKNAPGWDYFSLPERWFVIKGPNGKHQCLVYPVQGPMMEDIYFQGEKNKSEAWRTAIGKMIGAVASLHDYGFIHRDLVRKNIRLKIKSLNGMEEIEVLEVLGQPIIQLTLRTHTLDVDSSAPPYLVQPVDWTKVNRSNITLEPCLVQLREAIPVAGLCKEPDAADIWGEPQIFYPGLTGYALDLWVLALTLFEIRVGMTAMELQELEKNKNPSYYMDKAICLMEPPRWLTKLIRVFWLEPYDDLTLHDFVVSGVKHINQRATVEQQMSKQEVEAFTDFMEKFIHRPENRLAARKMLKHKWFSMEL